MVENGGLVPVAEVEQNILLIRGQKVIIDPSDSVFYLVKDHLGSTRLSYYERWNVAASYDYLPFGGDLQHAATSTSTDYRYTGQEVELNVGLYNYKARMYDPELGLFTSTDPAGQQWGPYTYAGNNPLSYVDPDGEIFIIDSWLAGVVSSLFDGKNLKESVKEGNSRANNDFQIWKGLVHTDSNRPWYQQAWQVISRVTWELPQTVAGFGTAQGMNLFGDVEDVDHHYGATVVESRNNNGSITLGSYITLNKGLDKSSNTFKHEYGHYMQSQLVGPIYLPFIGLPSIISAENNVPYGHHQTWTEH